MPDTITESVLTGKIDAALLNKWLNNESLEGAPEDCVLWCCNKNEFVACFLTFLRNQTESILQTNNAVQILQHNTPEKLLSTHRKHHRSISDPTSEDRTLDSLSVKNDRQRSHESPSRDKKRTGRRVKTKLFTEDKNNSIQSVSSDESRLSIGVDQLAISSTPIKNGVKPNDYPYLPLASPVTARTKENYERCDTPRLSHKHLRTQEKSCLGDYMVNVQRSTKKKRSARNSTDNEEKVELDLSSNDAFPEIGARKASSLRSEKRRIKPTNIDKSHKSVSLNSFSAECIQTSPFQVVENSLFKQPRILQKESGNNFETERNILKQERHKLMEKFNILNTTAPQINTPQIKITQKESIEKDQSFIKSDVTKIIFKDKIDLLIDIYEILLNNNLILSVNTEIYFLISILISTQNEDDCFSAQTKLNENDLEYILKPIHNSTYFAVKSLWHQRMILEIILDKTSLKTLGENKKLRSFCPDLAKFLLNCYGLRCEAGPKTKSRSESRGESRSVSRRSGMVCFNPDTDRADSFPALTSFHTFKKQRDMFYEILRWYQESPSSVPRSSLRSRVKALTSAGPAAANQAHLCALLVQHLLAHCLPTGDQESKLSKLQRRLTSPAAPESQRLPHFSAKEMFYKEFIMNAENDSFRVHLKDTFATEIIALDSTQIAPDDRNNSNIDISKEYLQLSKKLSLLAKFLGFVTSLPYGQMTSDCSTKTIVHKPEKETNYALPKEKVLENELALRNYSQPTMDFKGILQNAMENGRLSITIPWIVHYLSMLDYTSLRINYYQALLKSLIDIYTTRLRIIDNRFKKNTIIYLKSILGWLFDLPHFPQELFYENNRLNISSNSDVTVDCCDLVDESIIIELCPYLKDLNVLLSICRVGQDQREIGTYRHITPVSLILNPEDRIKNKEKELQARLEEELLKSQPSSTRRVLELVIERITSAVVKELSGKPLGDARERAREHARVHVRSRCGEDPGTLLQSLRELYSEHLQQVRSSSLEWARASIRSRAAGAVLALVAGAPPPLQALAARAAYNRLGKWLNDNWNTTAILCKDIEGEMKVLVALGDATTSSVKSTVDVTAMTSPAAIFEANNVSPAACIINLKEQVCLLLDGAEPTELCAVLASCSACCSPSNLFARPPTHRAILQLSIDLCIVYVSRKPTEINETFLSKLHIIWNKCCPDRKRAPPEELTLPERRHSLSPHFRNFEDDERAPTPTSDDESPPVGNGHLSPLENKCVNGTKNQIIIGLYLDQKNQSPQIEIQENQIFADQEIGPSKCQTKEIGPSKCQTKEIGPSKCQTKEIGPSKCQTKEIGPSKCQTKEIGPSKCQTKEIGPSKCQTKEIGPSKCQTKEIGTKYQNNNESGLEIPKDSVTSDVINGDSDQLLEFFDRVLCPRNIMLLSDSECEASVVWEGLASVLVFLLKNDYLSEDSLTEQCLAVYRQDWSQNILENLSTCMKSVSARWSRSSTGKFTLFLDFLAEYCGNMDYEPMDM